MRRRSILALAALTLALALPSNPPPAQAAVEQYGLYVQFFAFDLDDTQGVQLLVKWPDQPIPSGYLIGVPVAITTFNWPVYNYFFETGPYKDCRFGYDCTLHIYSA